MKHFGGLTLKYDVGKTCFAFLQDLYIDRPLPYLIGSQLFMEQDDVGLGDLSSEGV